jgi:Ca-activated chloride channel family protein
VQEILNVISSRAGALDQQRVPAHAFFVLGVSGSMSGEGLSDLQTSMTNLTGLYQSIAGKPARFRNRKKATDISLSDRISWPNHFVIDDTDPSGLDMQQTRDYVTTLGAGGYTALQEAYAQATAARAPDPDRYYTIVLMSDGENTAGISLTDFERYYRSLPAEAQNIRVFTVLFGDANEGAMAEIAELTGGRMLDGTKEER